MALTFKQGEELEGKNWVSLIYDKASNEFHSFQNPQTKDISIDDLELDHTYKVVTGNDAIKKFNSMYDENYELPKDLDESMFRVSLYALPKNVYATICAINIKKITKLIKSNSHIPFMEFLSDLFRFHHNYEKIRVGEKFYTELKSTEERNEEQRKKIISTASLAVDYYHDPIIDQPEECLLSLTRHQKANIHWMVELERNPKFIQYNINDELFLGDIVWDFSDKKFSLITQRNSLVPLGGALIDEVGIGKTIQAIMLTRLNPPKIRKLKDDEPSYLKYIRPTNEWQFYSKATLILCTPDIMGQWAREIQSKLKNGKDLKIITVSQKSVLKKSTYKDFLDADYVIVPYTMFGNPIFYEKWQLIDNYYKCNVFNHPVIETRFQDLGKELMKDIGATLVKTEPLFTLINWNRLMVDEFHESVTVSKYIYVKNMLPHLKADNRWIITGTPFIKTSMVDESASFLFNYPENDDTTIEEYITNKEVATFMIDYLFRRNTKDSTKAEYKIPDPIETVMWLKFSPTERMMYNAFLANPNNNKNSVYLRQLCCHPKLSEDTKYILSACHTLDDIERVMVQHYKNELINAYNRMMVVRNNTVKHKKKMLKIKKNLHTFLESIHDKPRVTKKDFTAWLKEYNSSKEKDFQFDSTFNMMSSDGTKEDETKDQYHALEFELMGNLAEGVDIDTDSDDEDEDKDDKSDDKKKKLFKLTSDGKISGWANFRKACDIFNQYMKRFNEMMGIFNGKLTTYRFYQNVVGQIRHIMGTTETDPILCILNEAGIIDLEKEEANKKKAKADDDDDEDDEEICIVCLCPIEEGEIGVTSCGHIGCYECLQQMVASNHQCPDCTKPLTASEIMMLNFEVEIDENTLTEKQKEHNVLINKVGTKLATLIRLIKESGKHTIIFSQWNDLLKRIGKVLSEHDILNVFCQGHVYQRDHAIRTFTERDDIKVIMLSSESSAAGTNLTKASQIVLVDPVYGSRKFRKDTENQAIGRAHRMGQTCKINIIRLVISDSIENEIYTENQEKDKDYDDGILKEEIIVT